MAKPRVAVVSPFLDKRHGTERSVSECLERLCDDYEIHVYSNRVEDVDLNRITWHRIPALPGPHLFTYLWWFCANHIWRWWDGRFRGLAPAIVFSPGINCLDADAIQVHVVFAQLREHMREQLMFGENPWSAWPQIVHRRMYYALIESLERRVYPNARVPLVAVSGKTAEDLRRFFNRTTNVQVAHHGLDVQRFQPLRREALRTSARQALSLGAGEFAVLLIGNDWKSKGLPCLLDAVGRLRDLEIALLVVGRDNPTPFRERIEANGLTARVHFLPPRSDVEFYYAAADIYASPSLEDSFGLPVAEAMACGLPALTSRAAGVSEIIHNGENGFVLENPEDSQMLASIVRQLATDQIIYSRIAARAVITAGALTWENTAAHIRAAWEQARQLHDAADTGMC